MFEKVATVLHIVNSREWDSGSCLSEIRSCLHLTIQKKQSGLMCYLLDKTNTASTSWENEKQTIYAELLIYGLRYKAYFIVHILCSKYIKDNSLWLQKFFQTTTLDIFLLSYLLRHIAKFRSIQIALDYHNYIDNHWIRRILNDFLNRGDIMSIWLSFLFIEDKKRYSKENAVISLIITQMSYIKNTWAFHIVQILLRKGFDADCFKYIPHMPDACLLPPIFYATQKGNHELVRLLIYHCCDLNISKSVCFPNNPETPTDVALKWGRYDILKTLLLSGANAPKDLHSKILGPCESVKRFEHDRFWLINWLQHPPSLSYFCRTSIRRTYGKRLLSFVSKIEYPRALKDYLTTKILL